MLYYFHRPSVAEHLVLLCFAAFPSVPVWYCLQPCAFGWCEAVDSVPCKYSV